MTVTSPTGLQRVVTITPGQGIVSDRTGTGGTTSYEYNAKRQPTKITAPEGNFTRYQYDARDNLTEIRHVRKPGSSSTEIDIVTTLSYPTTCTNVLTCNKPTSVTDPNGHATEYSYDPTHGGVTRIKRPSPGTGDRPEMRFGYASPKSTYYASTGALVQGPSIWKLTSTSTCASGNESNCVGTAQETRTDVSYVTGQNNLQPTSVTVRAGNNSLSATQGFGYTQLGQVTTVNGPLSGTADTITFNYDAAGNISEIRAPDPDGSGIRGSAAERYLRDTEGHVTDVQIGHYPSGNTSPGAFVLSRTEKAEYSPATGFKMAEAVASGSSTLMRRQFAYDVDGRLTCTTQRMNPAAFFSTANACQLGTPGSHGADRISKIDYDTAGRVRQVTEGFGTTAAGIDRAFTYTGNGKLATLTDGNGNKTTYTYNGQDRHSRTQYPSPTSPGTSSTTDYDHRFYDQNGNVTQFNLRGFALNSAMKVLFSYDALNRMTLKDVRTGENDTAYEYDLLGRMTKVSRAADGTQHLMSYDALGRLTQETQPFGSASYQYDLAGRRTRLTWNDGFYVSYDNDVTGNVTAIRENGASSGVGVLARYSYDDLGRRTGITRGNGTSTTYGYDIASRVDSLVQNLSGTTNDLTLGFTFNPASQIATNTRSNNAYAWGGHYNRDWTETANGLNQLTGQSGTPASGAAGTLGYDGRGNVTAMGTRTFTYSSENHLKSASGGVSLYYDGLDRLVEYDTSVSTRFAYDGVDMIAEVANPSGAITRRYVHGPGSDEPIVWYEGSGTTDRRWLHADERGSIIAISNASGAMTNINSYDEHGVPGASNAGRFGYTGQAWLPGLDMYYYKARIYAPMIGRFMQPDPIGYGGGMNLYAYVKGDPVNFVDPLGLNGDCNNASTLGCPPIVAIGSRLVTAGFGMGSAPVTGQTYVGLMDNISSPTASDLAVMAPIGAQKYSGCTFGRGPTIGKPNQYYQNGRVNSAGSGGFGYFDNALADVDEIANVNSITPLGSLFSGKAILGHIFTKPVPVGGGWTGSTNPNSSYTTFLHATGLAFRFNPQTGEVRVEIPSGFVLPGGGVYIGNGPEVCHYPR